MSAQGKAFRYGSALWGPQAPLRVAQDLRLLVLAHGELHLYVDPAHWQMTAAQKAVRMMPINLQEKVHLYAIEPRLWPAELQVL